MLLHFISDHVNMVMATLFAMIFEHARNSCIRASSWWLPFSLSVNYKYVYVITCLRSNHCGQSTWAWCSTV